MERCVASSLSSAVPFASSPGSRNGSRQAAALVQPSPARPAPEGPRQGRDRQLLGSWSPRRNGCSPRGGGRAIPAGEPGARGRAGQGRAGLAQARLQPRQESGEWQHTLLPYPPSSLETRPAFPGMPSPSVLKSL